MTEPSWENAQKPNRGFSESAAEGDQEEKKLQTTDKSKGQTDRDVGPEELVVPEQRAHVLHAALLLHAVADVRLEPGAKLDTQAARQRSEPRGGGGGARLAHHHEAVVQAGGVEQRPGLPGLLQDGQHDLVPQLPVEADDLLDVAEEPGGLHLRQQAALLQVDQAAEEELRRTPDG